MGKEDDSLENAKTETKKRKVSKEDTKAKKLRKKLERAKNEVEENFKVDLDDNRFSAVFQNADFNVDPSNPNFKATQSMLDIVAEKQKRAHKRDKSSKKR